jgi:hypothetical protein
MREDADGCSCVRTNPWELLQLVVFGVESVRIRHQRVGKLDQVARPLPLKTKRSELINEFTLCRIGQS